VAYSKIFKKSPGKTLVVCPLSLLYQWESEICQHIQKDVLSVNVYYGEQREAGIFENSDVILTTYGVLLQEYDKTPGEGRLMTEYWDRVILDEAHCIKNRSTNYFKSCAQLQAKHRWCLSGTPIQNSLEDVFSLICFLRYQVCFSYTSFLYMTH
jgi:DNA repair protein RAD5